MDEETKERFEALEHQIALLQDDFDDLSELVRNPKPKAFLQVYKTKDYGEQSLMDLIHLWLEERCITGPGWTSTKRLRDNFTKFTGVKVVAQLFGRILADVLHGVAKPQSRKGQRGWKGINIK